jgi:DNA-binding transcriptional LysR family regulator
MLEGVTIEQLRTLRAVADAGSFSAAARKLGHVQAAVSQSIERLEAQLGLRLFDRSGRAARLTEHGAAILGAARKVEGGLDILEAVVVGLKQGAETSLSIIVDVLFPTASLVGFARDFAREYPSVELFLFTDVLSAVTAHVREKRSTWGVAIEDADLSELERLPIADVRLLPVAASSHPLAKEGRSLDAAALSAAVQIVLGEHRAAGERAPEVHGVFSARTWRVVDLATKQALIVGSLGWGHLPEHLVREDLQAGRLVQLELDAWIDGPPRRSLMLVWRPEVVLGPVAKWAQKRLAQLCRAAVDAPIGAHHMK